MFLKHLPKKKLLLFFGDALLISLVNFISTFVRNWVLTWDIVSFSWAETFMLLTYLSCFYLADLYSLELRPKNQKFLFRFFLASCIAAGVIASGFFFLPDIKFGRGIFLINIGLIIILAYSWRLLFEWLFENILRRPKKLLIVGAGKTGEGLYKTIKDNLDYKILGFIDDDPSKWGKHFSCDVLGGCSTLKDFVSTNVVDTIVISITGIKGPELLKYSLDCKMNGVAVFDMPSFYEEVTGKVPVQHVDDFWFVFTPLLGVKRSTYNKRIKGALDKVLSFFGLILSLPVMFLTAILIKSESTGSVFYRQRRVGLNGKTFDVLKFRSMTVGAEDNGAVWAQKTDSRVTRVGRVIRKLRIDEIPQMWNVIKGEMSFIGPRPERPEFVSLLKEKIPYYSLRHSIRPGITGWAQVCYPYGATEEDAVEKLQYDLFYIKNLSPLLDFHILLKTVKVVIWGRGAR